MQKQTQKRLKSGLGKVMPPFSCRLVQTPAVDKYESHSTTERQRLLLSPVVLVSEVLVSPSTLGLTVDTVSRHVRSQLAKSKRKLEREATWTRI